MDKQLLILPFDHRSSFSKNILGISGKLNLKQKKEISDLKKIIFEGFLTVYKKYDIKDYFGILVDEEYGLSVLKQAKKNKAIVCLPVEKSGQKELKFEYGSAFGLHIKKINPDYVKVLVRYNPLNKEVNKKQLARLKTLGDFCAKNNYKIILELLVPPTEYDLKKSKTEDKYNNTLRLKRSVGAIKEIKKFLAVDTWKLEYFSQAGWRKIIRTVGKNSKIILLGRGENKAVVDGWIEDAAGFSQIVGFAIGRTIFLEELKKYHAGKITKKTAILKISNNFDYFVKLWAKHKGFEL
ncbi:DUF2090 domain-containing protein [Candidatus Falkowbacteria bacterium]|uniref:DUF2090 domain-containing protein n=1 Tax=Candidatus Buchananbacteria bacterium CG10_big_fil_rev_8_21_14_0_10_33_19 TaxID=1974525 RepID=A0A2H0W5J5_9BACT|nr:DUF2090 domain-containing protein [Candidatus Falkowbacteria bacterium]PIS05910.1 MAG: hypothetical protein COT80_04035 [Candidatus Buchananbacteria bacterium CG10_big_fil_rev_8_21_14_0_10_33_19]